MQPTLSSYKSFDTVLEMSVGYCQKTLCFASVEQLDLTMPRSCAIFQRDSWLLF